MSATINIASIPAELRSTPQWVNWIFKRRGDKRTKTPIDGRTGRAGSVTDRSIYTDFETALGRSVNYEGLGFAVTADDPYVGVDIDHCIDEHGEIEPWAMEIIDALDSYHEITPSGRGVRVWVKGTLPAKGHVKKNLGPDRKGSIEFYADKRYFTVTGGGLGQWTTIQERAEALLKVYARFFPPPKNPTTKPPAPSDKRSTPNTLSDAELLDKAFASATGAEIRGLFNGSNGKHATASERDLALCNYLAFWFVDAARIDAVFRTSSCMRPKWDERRGGETYGEKTIAKALDGRTEFYRPQPRKAREAQERAGGSNGFHKPEQPPGTGAGDGQAEDRTEPAPADNRRAIEINPERERVRRETLEELPRDPELYHRGRQLVVVVGEKRDTVKVTGKTSIRNALGTPRIMPLGEAIAGCMLSKVATFYRWSKDRNGEEIAVQVAAPDWLIRAVLESGQWPGVRRLDGVAEAPFIRPDGSIVETPGYDPQTCMLYVPSMDFPPVADRPTRADAIRAARLIGSVVDQVPFATAADRAVYLAAVLTAIARAAILGPTPGFVFNGNRRGCGKGLTIDTICLMVLGRVAPTMSYPEDPAEAAKVKLALALDGASFVHFDNLPEGGGYGGSAIDSAITSMTVGGRVLGSSKMVGELELRPVWCISGNNISPRNDADRRWLVANISTDEECPEERADIKVADLRAHVLERRGELVHAALTILRAHAVAGRPGAGWPPLGSFEAWDAIVRRAVWWATEKGLDCCTTRKQAATESPDRAAKVAVLNAWKGLPGGPTGLTVNQALELATPQSAIHSALMNWSKDGKLPSPRQIGAKIKGMANASLDRMKFEKKRVAHGFAEWAVTTEEKGRPKTNGPESGESGESGESYPNPPAGVPGCVNMASNHRKYPEHANSRGEQTPETPLTPRHLDGDGIDWSKHPAPL